MADIIEARDPHGIRITCSISQWNQHIALNHPIMERNKDAVRRTIEDPDYIFESHDSDPPLDERRIYTREDASASYFPKVPNTHVVVSICGGSGEVVTAYPSKTPTSGSAGEAIYSANRNANL